LSPPVAIETTPESVPEGAGSIEADRRYLPQGVDSAGLRLLACAAFVVLLVCLLILPSGPKESDETLSWLLAFTVAVPCGFLVAAYQERLLARAAPAAAARGLAAGVVLLALAFMLRRIGSGDRLHHAILLLAAVGALLAPVAAARLWRDPNDRDSVPEHAIAAIWLAGIALIFVPSHALRPANLAPALGLTALLLLLFRFLPDRRLTGRARHAVDVVLCVVIALAVVQLPTLTNAYIPTLVYHQGYFLGPVNDVLHGRAMLAGAWSQYGVGLIDALALVFTVIPIGFGTLMLIVLALTAMEYVCVYAILRLAGLGQVLVVVTIAAAGAGNLFSPLAMYFLYPSTGPLRFGLPYLIVLCAVLGARFPARARAARIAMLVPLALGATWSFETFVYCGAAYGCVVLVEAVAGGTQIVRRAARGAAVGLAVSAAAVALLSLVTLVLDGRLEWGPYFEYLKLYTTGELGALPVVVFSAGPLMGATIFLTGVALLWLVRRRPAALEPPIRSALAGFTGLALAMFTYYLGRSHPNNLLNILVPTIVLTGLWAHVMLRAPATLWRTAGVSVVALGWSMIAVASWPSVEEKAPYTALALAIPGQGHSLRLQLDGFADNPAFNPLAQRGVEMLAKHLPPHAPALVITQQDLTTEILMRAGRRNLLPISHPPEDILIESSSGRVRESAESVPAGTLMLTSPVPEPSGRVAPVTELPLDYNELQLPALELLHRRFRFRLVEGSPQSLELVRLVPRAGDRSGGPVRPPG
jgi:hypothetical protein